MDIKSKFDTNFKSSKIFWWIIGFAVITIFFGNSFIFRLLLGPLQTFETVLHEASHALACLFTGGWVSGLTIVDDGRGHGGLTFCHGGIPFIYGQAGYIGETLWGCLLIALSRFHKISRIILVMLGVSLGLVTLIFMPGTMFVEHRWMEGFGSMAWGLILSGFFIFAGWKLPSKVAHILLLFVAVQSCLSSLQDIWVLVLQATGAFPGTWSDATNIQNITGIPALFWGICWALFSIGMLSFVLWTTFKLEHGKK